MAHLEKDNIFQCFTQLFKNWGNHLARPTPEILLQIHPKSVWDNCYQVAKKSTTTSFSPAAVTWDGISDNNQHDWDDPSMHQYQPKTSEKPTWFLKSSVSVTACTMFELSRTLQVDPQSKTFPSSESVPVVKGNENIDKLRTIEHPYNVNSSGNR